MENVCSKSECDKVADDVDCVQLIKAEIPLVEKIINDETWYEGERRNCSVSREDKEVQLNAAKVVLREGDKILREALGKLGVHKRQAVS